MSSRRRNRRSWMWAIVAIGALIALTGLGILLSNVVITRSAAAHIVQDPSTAPRADVAIVLGARVYSNGSLSPMLRDRLETGVRLYTSGKVRKLLLSGDHGQVTYDEVTAMLRYVRDRGVPDQDIFTDHAGFSTYDTMYRAREVFAVRKALVITQGFHLSRAVYTARSLGLEATGVASDIQPYTNEWRFALREWLARAKAFFQLHVTHPEPRYLGPVIPIDGDGRSTRG